MRPVTEYFAGEERYEDLNTAQAVEHLAAAIRCRTVNNAERSLTDVEFDRLHELIRKSFPAVMAAGNFETVGRSILITIPGTDESLRPCLYMSHQDVVPVIPGTEKDWTYDAFSGAVENGFIWGRGTLDIKQMVFGILEAAEYLLSRGQRFRRTAYFAFGDDEETLNQGALALAELLQSRGVRLEFVLDEGGGILEDGACFGAPGKCVSLIDMMEKGYADLELSVESAGGHSSRPWGGTSLEHLAKAIAAVAEHPFALRLPEAMAVLFEALSPSITEEPLRTLVQDVRGNADAIAAWCAGKPETFAYVTTTIAPTVIEGGSAACNVLPQNMRAVINFRLNEGDCVEELLKHAGEVIADDTVNLRYLQANNPSATARSDGLGYHALTEVLSEFYPGIAFVPGMTAGATDARRYECICDTCLRCSPFISESADVLRGVHGTDERISVRSYMQGIRVLIRLMEIANL